MQVVAFVYFILNLFLPETEIACVLNRVRIPAVE